MRKQSRILNDALPRRGVAHSRISPGAARRSGPRKWIHRLFLCIVSTVSLAWPHASGRAEEPTVELVTQNNSPAGADSTNLLQYFPRVQIFTQFRTGFDDNSQTSRSSSGSGFTSEQVSFSYHSPHRRLPFDLVAGVGNAQYFGRRTNTNAFFDLSFSRRIAPRLTLNASLDANYQPEPDLASNVSLNNFRGSYFSVDNRFWASYALTRRFSTVSSFNFNLLRYQNEVAAAFTDRESYTFGEQLRFALTRTTVLTSEYRLSLVDYVTAPFDSMTHFFLAGVEHRFNSKLRAQARVGASIRSYDVGGRQINPDFESSLEYILSRRTSMSWTGSYSIEQPQQTRVATQKGFRTGLAFSHSFTGRIGSSLAFSYSHQTSQQGISLAAVGPTFNQDVFSLSLQARYRISHRLSFNASYEHAEVSSGRSSNQYARNRISGGFNFSF